MESNLIRTMLFGTIALMIIATVVILFMRLYKKHKKEKSDRLAKEAVDKKRQQNLKIQQQIGRDLEICLTEAINERQDNKYVVNCYPNNFGNTIFSIIIRDVQFNVDVYQIDINAEIKKIEFIGNHNRTSVYEINQIQEFKNIIRKKIAAL